MTLTLRAVSLNEQPLTQPITAHFDAKGGTIGRHDDNTLALPDPERHISRRQAEIRAVATGYTIRNVGSANPIVIRGQPLGRGETTALAHRDQVRIGGYLLEVIDEEDGAEASTITRGRASVEASVPTPPRTSPSTPRTDASPVDLGGPFADLAYPASSGDPFADLLGPGATPSPAAPLRSDSTPAPQRREPSTAEKDPFADLVPPAAGVLASSSAWGSAAPSSETPKLPDDFDPFAPRQPSSEAVRPEAGRNGLFDDLIPGARPAAIDSVAPLEAGTSDALADFLDKPIPGEAGTPKPRNLAGAVPTDPMEALFGTPASSPPQPSAHDDTPELRAAYIPPAAMQRSSSPDRREIGAVATPEGEALAAVLTQDASPLPGAETPLVPPSAHPPAEVDGRELWEAFCEGAGVNVDLTPTPELMRVVGSLLRNAVEGTLRLMEVRRMTKHELRAEVTVIRSRDNNPLKFSPDAQVALEQLLKPPVRGFLPGPAAMTDAMHDLVGHSIGTMAGTRAALEGVLDRFAPGELESKLVGKSVLDSVFPAKRQARLWNLYLQEFEAIRGEAKDDFDALFGKAFVAAYEQQLDRLESEKPVAVRTTDA
jgi:FHA domain-containing protein